VDVNALADVQAVKVDHQSVRNVVDGADEFDAVAHNVENAAAAQTRGALLAGERYRYGHGDLCPSADPHEVDMNRRVSDRVILDIARQGAMRVAVDPKVNHGGEESRLGDGAP